MFRGTCRWKTFGHEWGRRGSEWADTLGKLRHGVQEGFEMVPGPLGGHTKCKNYTLFANRLPIPLTVINTPESLLPLTASPYYRYYCFYCSRCSDLPWLEQLPLRAIAPWSSQPSCSQTRRDCHNSPGSTPSPPLGKGACSALRHAQRSSTCKSDLPLKRDTRLQFCSMWQSLSPRWIDKFVLPATVCCHAVPFLSMS